MHSILLKTKSLLLISMLELVYNWGLNKVYENWEQNRSLKEQGLETSYLSTSMISMRKLWNTEKDISAPWWKEVGKEAYSSGLSNLEDAIKRYHKKLAKKPTFKSKSNSTKSFTISTGNRHLDGKKHIKLTRIGSVKLAENPSQLRYLLRKEGSSIGNVTISFKRNRWYISINVKVTEETFAKYHNLKKKTNRKEVVGIDLGITSMVVTSDGETFTNPKHYEQSKKKLRKLNKELHRRKKGSANREKTRLKLLRLYAKITNQELDFSHKLSKYLVDNYQLIGTEDLNVKGMVKNRKLSRMIAHSSWGRVRTQLQYKSKWYQNNLTIVDRFYPSSKKCSSCGQVKAKLELRERVYRCDCGFTLDRDLNAAINIEKKAVTLSCRETLNGYGEVSSDLDNSYLGETNLSEVTSSNLVLEQSQ